MIPPAPAPAFAETHRPFEPRRIRHVWRRRTGPPEVPRDGLAVLAIVLGLVAGHRPVPAAEWEAGFSKIDVTPDEPVRLAGYGNRETANVGVDASLFVRCLALRPLDRQPAAADDAAAAPTVEATPSDRLVLVSIESIGTPGAMTREIARVLEERHGLRREQVVFSNTHTHTGPDLASELSNIFGKPLTEAEEAAGLRYRKRLHEAILEAVAAALDDVAPAALDYASGQVTFAANRRVLTDGIWSGFGVQPDGPVDHSLPVLRVTDPASGRVRGLVFNYACHCTTLGGDHNRVHGDWAGVAAVRLETAYPDAVALCTIGCGGDANPEPRGTLAMAQAHGETVADEVRRVIADPMRRIDAAPEARFDYAALSFDLPTQEELRQRLQDRTPQTRRHAQQLLEVYQREGRLPATYPVPIQAWKFGDQLTMVFLGGEVVVDYALRLKRELEDSELWVTAYANDVLGYIASERMRSERGYEYDRSGVYYGLPGPWAAGTEDFLIGRVKTLVRGSGRSRPRSPEESLGQLRVADGFVAELVASEPLVRDPINLAFAADGRLWVVEMGDYPEGDREGRIRVLRDVDGDGVFDEATTFLDGLSFPTGVQPWRDGVLIAVAPDILFARDTSGDGRADEVETLYTGFRLANPQHRVSGFGYGLDHALHLASGDSLGEITSVRSGQVVNASGHDVLIRPDDGGLETTSGRTQYIRARDDWGRWFGNDNSRPMYHFPIESRYFKRNPAARYRTNQQQLFDPPVAPPVFPVTEATERFNDLFAANRFTSACSSIVARSPYFRVDDRDSLFICEPVHNLVHRSLLTPDGSSFRAERAEGEGQSEFLASADPWFRPVRVETGPDGMLWVVDMYREVIEHPEWIPQAWQQQLDLKAGHRRGRIYRVRPAEVPASKLPRFTSEDAPAWIEALRSPFGTLRDMAQRQILHLRPEAIDGLTDQLIAMARDHRRPETQVHALAILDASDRLSNELLREVLDRAISETGPDGDGAVRHRKSGVLIVATAIAESRFDTDPTLLQSFAALARHPDAAVVLQLALSLGEADSPSAGRALAEIAGRRDLDTWMRMAVTTSAATHAATIAEAVLRQIHAEPETLDTDLPELFADVLESGRDFGDDWLDRVADLLIASELPDETRLRLATAIVPRLRSAQGWKDRFESRLASLDDAAWALAFDRDADLSLRVQAMNYIRAGASLSDTRRDELWDLLDPTSPAEIQRAAVDDLVRRGDPTVVEELADRWGSLTRSVRDHAIRQVLSRRPLTERLLDLLEDDRLQTRDLSPAARQQLLQSGTQSMKARAARLVDSGGSPAKRQLVTRYLQAFVEQGPGDSASHLSDRQALGRELFQKHCAVCHVATDRGPAIGPSLENLTDLSDRNLVEAVLNPNLAVEPEFENYLVQTTDDRILAGVIESEVGNSLTLAQADGARITVRRDQVEAIRGTGLSLMPEGFEEQLSPHELQSIFVYLRGERGSPAQGGSPGGGEGHAR